jgi:hypothetical protein
MCLSSNSRMATRGPAWVLGLRHPASRVSWSCAERWAETLLGGVAAAALTAGCGTGSPNGSAPYDLPTGQRAASTAAVVFATGEELHIGTRTYPIRPAPQTMVDTAGGLYYLTHGVLYQWDRDHEPSLRVATSAGSAGSRPLSTDASWRSSTTSTVPAILAATGSPRPSSSTRPPASNWCAMRPETDPGPAPRTCPTCTPNRPPTILGFDDDAVYAQTAKGGAIARWDLEDGHRSDLGDNEYPVTENRPGGPLVDVNLVHGVPRETPAAEAGTARGRGAALSCWQAGPTQTGSTASPSTRPSAPPRR